MKTKNKNKKHNKNIKMKSLLLKQSLDSDEDSEKERLFTRSYNRSTYGQASVYATSLEQAKELFDNQDCDFDDNSSDDFEWDGDIEDSEE